MSLPGPWMSAPTPAAARARRRADDGPDGHGGVGLRGPREPGGSGHGRDRLRGLDTMLIFECYGEDVTAVPGTPVLFPSPHDFPPRPPPKERLVEQLVRARALGPPWAALRGLRDGSHAVVASMASGAAPRSPTAASRRNSASERAGSPRSPAAPLHLRELPPRPPGRLRRCRRVDGVRGGPSTASDRITTTVRRRGPSAPLEASITAEFTQNRIKKHPPPSF